MNRSKKYMMVAALATLSCGAMAQGLNTGYFIDGYTFRHNLNPAYGNDQNYVSTPALGNIQVRTQGNFGLGKTSKEFIPLSSNASLNLGMNVTF